MQISFRAYFLKPDDNSTASLGVHPEDILAVEEWKDRHHIGTAWMGVTDASGVRLNALRPIEGRCLEQIEALGIQNGALCHVSFRAVRRGDRSEMHFDSIRQAN